MLAVRLAAVGLLLLMALCQWTWARPFIILPMYVMRYALANCTYAISKSILNDYVPKVRCLHCCVSQGNADGVVLAPSTAVVDR